MDFARAITEYQEAYRIVRDPSILYQLGRAYHRDGKWSEALAFYEKYQREVPDPDPQLKRVLDEYMRQLRSALRGAQTLQDQSDPQRPAETPSTPPPSGAAPSQPPSLLPAPAAPLGAAQKLQGALQRKPEPAARPLYKQPWFWGVVGGSVAAVVAGGVGLRLALRPVGPSLPPDLQVRSIQPTLFTISGGLP